MKKLFSLFAAALFATAMSAATVTFTASDFFGTGSPSPGSAISVEKDGVTVSVDKGYGTNSDEIDQGLRIFGGSVLTVSATSNITKIHAEFTDYTKMEFDDQEPNATEWSITASKQIRIKTLEVTLEDAAEPLADGFYLLANAFEWDLAYGVRLDPNMGTEGEYMVRMNLEPTFDYEMKVVRVEGGKIAQWYPEGEGNNMVPDATGDITLYFRPEGNTEWPQNFIYVTPAPEHYYLVGDFTDWQLDTDYEFSINTGVGLEEWVLRMQLPTAEWLEKSASDIKVVGTIGDVTDPSNWIWFPGYGFDNMTPEHYGDVEIYFRPYGNPDWKNVFTYVAEHEFVSEYYLLSDQTDPAWAKQEDKQFLPVEDMEGIFVLTTTLKENEHLKGGLFIDGNLYQMLPGSGDDNYWTVDAAHSGDVIIYLSLELVEDWLTDFPAGLGYLMIEKAPDYLLPSQAARLAKEGMTDEVEIQGIVTSVGDWYQAKANIDFWMADELCDGNVFKAFRVACASAADAPKKGDLVRVTGKLTVYKGTPETEEGGTFVIKEEGREADNLGAMRIDEAIALNNCLDAVVLTGVVTNIAMDKDDDTQYNQYGNFDLIGIDGDLGKVYVYGLLNAAGEKGKFREMGVDSSDTLTIKAVLSTFTDTEGNVKNEAVNAVYVEHREFVAPPVDGFYLIGDRTEWKIEGDALFERNYASTEVEEYMYNAFLSTEEFFKVAKVEEGKIVAYYPEGGEETNLHCDATGAYTIYFRPEGNKDWPLNYVYLDAQWGYYLVGDFNEWEVGQPECWMERNEAADGEEYAVHINLPEGTTIKVVGVAAGMDDVWFPASVGEDSRNVTPEAYGDVVVYFRPKGGMADWEAGYGYIHVMAEAEEEFINCEQAVALAAAEIADPTAVNTAVEGGLVVVRGFVITPGKITSGAPSRKAQKQSAWIADDPDATEGTIKIYDCEITQELKKGDLVEVTGTLAKFKQSGGDIIVEVLKGSVEVLGGGEGKDIDVICEDLEIDKSYFDWFGCVILAGTTAEFEVEAYLYPEDETVLYGDYTSETAEIYLTNPDDEDNYITVTVDNATFVNDPTLGDVFTAEGLGDDGNLYTVTMKLVLPDPLGDRAIEFKSPAEYQFYGDTKDWYYFVKDEAEAIFTIDIYSDDRAGEFEGDDIELYYTTLALIDGADTTYVSFYNMKATVTENEAGEGLVVAEGFGKDAYNYTITFAYQVVKPTETVEISDEDASFADVIADYGMFGVQGKDGDVLIQMFVISDAVVGAYTFKDLYTSNSGVMVGEETFGIVDGSFDVSIEDEYWVVIQGEVLASNGVLYKFVFKSNQEPMAIENANGENRVTKMLREGQIIIIKNGVEYNVVGARVK